MREGILVKDLICLMEIVVDLLGLLWWYVEGVGGGPSKRLFEVGSVGGSI